MNIPKQIFRPLLAAGLLTAAPVFAGSYSTDFNPTNPPTDLTIAGTPGAYYTNQPSNRAVLTVPAPNQSGSITLPDLDTGQAIESFTATFKLQLGPIGTSSSPADGVSFNFGPDVLAGDVLDEEGLRDGNALPNTVTIEFDTYDNGGGEAPALDVKYGGNEIAHHAMATADLVTSQLADVSIQLTRNGKVSVAYNGQIIHTNVFLPGWGPTAGLFNISGSTRGSYEEADIATLTINTVLQGTAVAPTILTAPASVTVNERDTNTFTVAVDGTAPFSFQWTDNGTDIAGETNYTFTMGPIPFTENGHLIRVRVSNPASTTGVTSGAATLTVIPDTTPPTVVKANADVTGTLVTVVYSEPVTDTALSTANYSINQGVTISSVTRVNATTVTLTTSQMAGGLSFNLSIHGVQDTASTPNTIVPTQVNFRTYVFVLGAVTHKKYTDPSPANSTGFTALQADPRYPNSPDRQDIMQMFEYPANGLYRDTTADPGGGGAITFSDTLECYFIPPVTTNYVFFAAGADLNDVYLSTDDNPANIVNVAQENGWTNPREWCISQCGTTNGERSDWYTANAWAGAGDPTVGGALIPLTAGQRYYLIAFHHRDTWSGADDFAVSFAYGSNAPIPAAGSAPLLTGSNVATYLDPTGADVTYVQQPTNAIILQGRAATFTALATGSSLYGTNVSYQWQSAPKSSSTFTNIPGATANSYTTPVLGLADSGTQFQVLASVPSFTVPSSIVSVTVNPDIYPPNLVAASALLSRSNGTFDVGITFDEPLDPTTAQTLANYTVAGGTATAVKYFAGSPGVVLTVPGLTVGQSYSVTVQNVADPYGNHMTSANLPFTVSKMQWGVVGADELNLGNGVVAVSTNEFDVYSDGIAEWGTYDEATFVYEQVTGDFDKEVRVEYQDPSSEWARAGLIVRDVTNFGVNRTNQTGSNIYGTNAPPFDGLAGRYQKVHVNPVITAMGTPGNDAWEGNRRLDTGSICTTALTANNGVPMYPNAWCRLQRVGQTFNIFRSDDGVNWLKMGGTTWGVDDQTKTPMPNTVYVGMDFSPENGNISTNLFGMFVTKYRDYRDHAAAPTLAFTRNADGSFTLTYTGRLYSAQTVTGTYGLVSGASSPWPINPNATGAPTTQYYRAGP